MSWLRSGRTVYVPIALVALLAAGAYWGYFLPAQRADASRIALRNTGQQLRDNSNHLVTATTLPVFSDLTEEPASCYSDLSRTAELVSKQRALLDAYDAAATAVDQPYAYGLSRGYAVLAARHAHARSAVRQSRQVVDRLEKMTDFLKLYTKTKVEFGDIVLRFASMTDLNEYAGRSVELRADADRIDNLAKQLGSAETPAELTELRDTIASLYSETAAGYRDLANGIEVAVDDQIYSAARRIEAATMEYDTDVPVQYSRVMAASVTLRFVEELPDKYLID